MIKWPHKNRNEDCSADAMDCAPSIEVLQWLLKHRTKGCACWATANTAYDGHFEKLRWMRDKNLAVVTQETTSSIADISNFEIYQWLHSNFTTQERLGGNGDRGPWEMFRQFEAAR